MRLLFTAICLCLSLGLVTSVHAQVPDSDASSLEGSWQGTLDVPGASLQVVIHLDREDTQWRGTLDSPDQGVSGLTMDTVTVQNDSLSFAINDIAGRYEGHQVEADTVHGTWMQGGSEFALVLARTEEPATTNRPQTPQEPFPYSSETITFAADDDGPTLTGVLTRPEDVEQPPAIVLVSGSGPHDRDGETMGHATLLVLGDYLTRQGFAVLRYDERGIGASEGTFDDATTPMLATDVKAALHHLRSRSDVDADRLGIIGHSEGGMIAAKLAAENPDWVQFIVLLGAPGIPGDAILQDQLATSSEEAGMPPRLLEAQLDTQAQVFKIMKQSTDSTATADTLRTLIEKTSGVSSGEVIDREIAHLMDPWFVHFVSYDPAEHLRQITQPTLALIGTLDQQVRPELNVDPLRDALEAAPTDTYAVETLDGLNHLFQTAETGSPNEYGQIEETLAPAALERIVEWIRTNALLDTP